MGLSYFTLPLMNIFFLIIVMNKGTVKFFNESKGFGFIKEDETNQEYFVHVSGLIDEIREDDAVEFELKEGRKGMNAVNVRVL
ncbi:cold shock-like protein CspC [Saccharicrinis fermentans DSM 9555 = JCM 21142]|uniref:Cold shock-like protein CspC n=2 Tax=Saccharicrinis TaxID=1618113 RepID=W7Y490_9BACT|nr:cold shock-like protein CspC [Saccharicrinis fermentans DSM 9555 = JCM 21142]